MSLDLDQLEYIWDIMEHKPQKLEPPLHSYLEQAFQREGKACISCIVTRTHEMFHMRHVECCLEAVVKARRNIRYCKSYHKNGFGGIK